MSFQTNPLISIVVPAYNYGRFLGACIDGVLAQTYTNWELIIIDNGSSDNTQEVLARYLDSRIRAFRIETNSGPVEAWAMGYERSRGEYFALLPADDCFLPTKLERQVKYLREHPDINAVATYIQEIDADGNTPAESNSIIAHVNQRIDFSDLKYWRWTHHFCIPTAIYSKELCDRAKAIPFDGLDNICDWDFHVKLISAGAKFAVIPEALTLYRWHSSNTSQRKHDTNSQWIYSYLKSYIPALRKLGEEVSHVEIRKCMEALYESRSECYFLEELSQFRRCAHLEALLNPEGCLEEFSSFKQFLNYCDRWVVNSENRAAIAALDSSIMALRSKLLCSGPIDRRLGKDILFPLENYAFIIENKILYLQKGFFWNKYQLIKKAFWKFADSIRGKTWPE